MRLIWGISWRLGLVLGLVVGGAVAVEYSGLPELSDLMDGRTRGSVTLLDRSGEVFAWRGDQFDGGISATTVSPHLKNAVVATEDRRFYLHPGLDPIGILGAMRINLSEGRSPLSGHGGSSITQQTAKLLCVGRVYDPQSGQSEAEYESECRTGTISRKLREAVYALAMEVKYSKDDILTIYMNRAYLGAGTRGFEAASQRYFGKSARQLTAPEAAMLAGLLKAPTRYAPTTNLEGARARAEVILGLMANQGYLTESELARARANPASLSRTATENLGGYFADWIMSSGPDYLTKGTTEDVVITTTLDRDIQRAAEEAVQRVFDQKVSPGSKAETALVVLSPDGAVRAMVGGRQGYVPGGFNRASQAKRQTGSAFKPFVYAAALEMGYGPLDTILDEPLTLNVTGSSPWTPQNYTRTFRGEVTLLEALRDSLNIPAVKVSEAMGRDNVRKIASDFGIESDLADGPALALGTSEASLLETTAAYAGILNGGR
ncbi:MAG: transglycosylase domain-containing protein, partial [Mangrovicoccus sp.]